MSEIESDITISKEWGDKQIPDIAYSSIPDATTFPHSNGIAAWKSNFDRIIVNPTHYFFGIIDGAGKTLETWYAARIVRREFQKSLKKAHLSTQHSTVEQSEQALFNGYLNSKRALRRYLQEEVPDESQDMLKSFTVETTATIVDFISPNTFNIFHLGDSRLYIYNKYRDALEQLTPDQSYLDQQEINRVITPYQNKKIQKILDNLQSEQELDFLVLPSGEVVKTYDNQQYRALLAMRAFPVRNAWENKRYLSSSVNTVGKEKPFIKTYELGFNDSSFILMSDGIYENTIEDEVHEEMKKLTESRISTQDVKRTILDKAITNMRNPFALKRMPDDISLIVGRFMKN